MFRRNEGDERQDPMQPGEAARPVGVGPGVRTPAGGGSEVTVVGKGAHLDGNLVSAGSLQIDGQVSGKITADGDVKLSPQSQVEADIEANNVIVAGSFKGNITARSRAELSSGGRVNGNITSKTLIVSEGAFFSGQSIMDSQPGQQVPQRERAPDKRPTGVGTPPPQPRPTAPGGPGVRAPGGPGAGPETETTRTGR